MKQDGFSLTEMLVVLCISAILLSMATLKFSTWNTKNKIETQFRAMYADLMGIRSQSLFQKRGKSVRITATGFSVYSSIILTTSSISPIRNKTLKAAVTTVPGNLQIDFDTMGFATFNNSTTSTAYVCAQTMATKAFYNSLILARTRMQMGSLAGTGCTSAIP